MKWKHLYLLVLISLLLFANATSSPTRKSPGLTVPKAEASINLLAPVEMMEIVGGCINGGGGGGGGGGTRYRDCVREESGMFWCYHLYENGCYQCGQCYCEDYYQKIPICDDVDYPSSCTEDQTCYGIRVAEYEDAGCRFLLHAVIIEKCKVDCCERGGHT